MIQFTKRWITNKERNIVMIKIAIEGTLPEYLFKQPVNMSQDIHLFYIPIQSRTEDLPDDYSGLIIHMAKNGMTEIYVATVAHAVMYEHNEPKRALHDVIWDIFHYFNEVKQDEDSPFKLLCVDQAPIAVIQYGWIEDRVKLTHYLTQLIEQTIVV